MRRPGRRMRKYQQYEHRGPGAGAHERVPQRRDGWFGYRRECGRCGRGGGGYRMVTPKKPPELKPKARRSDGAYPGKPLGRAAFLPPSPSAWHNSGMKLLKRYSNIAFCAALLAVALSVAVITFPHVNHVTTATPKAAVILAHGPTFPPNPWCD